MLNYMKLNLLADSKNEALSRSLVGAFAVELPFTLEDINDIKTAVSEAVTNCIVHGYNYDNTKEIIIECKLYSDYLQVYIIDNGCGIKNINEAMQPFYTTKPNDERSGMGFTIMSTFMDNLTVKSNIGEGTEITFIKKPSNV